MRTRSSSSSGSHTGPIASSTRCRPTTCSPGATRTPLRRRDVSAFDAVLFDFRGTLFNVEDDPTWIRNAALSIGRVLTDDEVAETCRRLNETLAARPDLKEGLDRCDISLAVHRAALLAWFAATGLDDEL